MPDTITTYAQIKAINAGQITCYTGWYWKGGTSRSGGVPSRCLPDPAYNRRKFDLRLPDGAGVAANDVLCIEYDPNPATAWKPVRQCYLIKGIAQAVSFELFGVNLSSTLSLTQPKLAKREDGKRHLLLPRVQYEFDVRLFGKFGFSMSAGNLKPREPAASLPEGIESAPEEPLAPSDVMTTPRERAAVSGISNGVERDAARG
jgi:hypothetical protein